MTNRHNSRVANLLYGATSGTICASLIFGTAYAINGGRPPLAFDRATTEAFVAFVHWGWFFGIVGLVACIGFVFNTRLVYTPYDVVEWFH